MADLSTSTTSIGVSTTATFSSVATPIVDPFLTQSWVWRSLYSDETVGVKTFATFQGNITLGSSGVGVKTFATFIEPKSFSAGFSGGGVGVRTFGTFTAPGPQDAWVKWSKISTTDFTIDKTSRAGRMPLDWPGRVSNIRKLGSHLVAYGTNGVSALIPAGKMFGLNTLHRTGLIGRDAFAGTDVIHYFIDNLGRLYSLTQNGLSLLDYREYLVNLSAPVLTLDEANNLLFICDGNLGFIYSPDSKSLGSGPVNVTGIGYQSEVKYITAPDAIVTPKFKIWTDIYDLGSRKGKNIQSIEVGIDMSENLWAAVRYRLNKSEGFTQTDWYLVDKRGQVFIPCYGYEFQFGLMSEVYEYFEIDYLTVNGDGNAY